MPKDMRKLLWLARRNCSAPPGLRTNTAARRGSGLCPNLCYQQSASDKITSAPAKHRTRKRGASHVRASLLPPAAEHLVQAHQVLLLQCVRLHRGLLHGE